MKISEEKMKIGLEAEKLVFNEIKNKLIKRGFVELADKVKWVSREGDGIGYDILAYDIIDGKEIELYIEVKATVGELTDAFDISKNELNFAKENKDNYKIYRVGNMREENPKYFVLENDLEEYLKFEPTNYKATFNNKK